MAEQKTEQKTEQQKAPTVFVVPGAADKVLEVNEAGLQAFEGDEGAKLFPAKEEAEKFLQARQAERITARFRKQRVIAKVARQRAEFLSKNPKAAAKLREAAAVIAVKHPGRESAIEAMTAKVLEEGAKKKA